MTDRLMGDPQTEANMPKTKLLDRLPKTGVIEIFQDHLDQYFPEHLREKVDHFFTLFRNFNDKLPELIRRSERDFIFLEHFSSSFLIDRNRRGEEVQSERYEKTQKKAAALIPVKLYYRLCMDGRVKAVHTNGMTADTAGAIRTPGAGLKEFIRIDGKLVLDPQSNYASRLDASRQVNDYSSQDVDSHLRCAARSGEERATGSFPGDFGLFRDVMHKAEEIQASQEYLASHDYSVSNDEGELFFIQTSFDPITGYSYMGLETPKAVEHAKEKARNNAKAAGKDPEQAARYAEYTKDVLRELIEEGKIISTGHLISQSPIKEAFEREYFEPDRVNRYVETAEMFWDKIEILWPELLPVLKEKLVSVFPELEATDEATQKELEQRAMLLLTNAFNAHIHNKDHNEMEYLEMDDEQYEEEGHYQYDKHDEAGVKVSEGGHPPYHIPMFVIYSEDIENLSAGIELASGIVRENRLKERVKDTSGQYDTKEDFTMAPIPVVMQEIIRNAQNVQIEPKDWKHLEGIDWEDLPKNWHSMSENQFRDYLIQKGISNALLQKGILNLRKKMARIYDPSQESSSHLNDLYKVALPIVCDQDRITHTIIPFVKVAREHTRNSKAA